MILVPFGAHRKATQRAWIKLLVWTTYLTAESVPILTLGVISNWLSNLKDQNTTGALARKYELIALWAPMLLVHLGGPDSITAYALADNELWLRHFARVSVQIGLTCYIYFLALSSSPLSYIAAAVILIGILKNYERTFSLYCASKDEFRNSLISPPRSGLLYPRITEKVSLKKEEGHIVTLAGVTEIHAPEALSLPQYSKLEKPQDRNGFIAYQLLKIFKALFADLIVNLRSLESIRSLLTEVTSENAFKIIDIELNLMFESLYTKAGIIYKFWGVISKITSLTVTLGVVLAFCMVDKRVYELKLDLSITFIVILGLLLSEISSIIKAISSDRMYALSIEWKSRFMYRLISCIQSSRRLSWLGFTTEGFRWSRTLIQFNILGFAVKKTPPMVSFNHVIKKLYEKMMQYVSVDYQPVGGSLSEWIHTYLTEKAKELDEEPHPSHSRKKPWLPAYGAIKSLYEMSLDDLTWSTDENDFSRTIVIWHIATEILYHRDRKSFVNHVDNLTKGEISRTLSHYLTYLLVQMPAMLPIGIGDNYYAPTLLEAQKFFDDQRSRISSHEPKNFGERIGLRKNYGHEKEEPFCCKADIDSKNEEHSSTVEGASKTEEHKSREELNLCRICHMLLEVSKQSRIPSEFADSGGNKSVLFHASHLASQLIEKVDINKRWEVIKTVWTETLLYSAYHCSGDAHAKRLSHGGEFLTHVWLLMSHLCISKQVKNLTNLVPKRLVES